MQRTAVIKTILFFLILLTAGSGSMAQDTLRTRGGTVTAEKDTDTLKGEVYAIITGVSTYPGINPLKYADADAILFRNFLQTPAGGNARPENILSLINDSAKAADFNVKAYSWLRNKKLKKGDRLYIYFSGHGDAMEGGLYFFLPYDCAPNKDDHNYLGTGNIDLQHVKTLFVKPQTAKGVEVFLIMDACRTNELPGGKEGQQNFANNFIAEQKMGEIILLSTGPGMVSIEDASIGNGHGLFTYYLIDGLAGAADKDATIGDNDGKVSLSEIGNYVKLLVKKIAKSKFGTDQIPFYCCSEKDLVTIAHVNETVFTTWENAKKLQQLSNDQNLFAMNNVRAGQRAVYKDMDSNQVRIYNQFNEALKNERLTGEGSAESYYQVLESKWNGTMITEDARFTLATRFVNFCQQKINLFLSGKGIVHILNLEKKAAKENSDTAKNSLAGVNEDEMHKLKTLVSTDYITAAKMMEKAVKLLKDEPELIDPYLPRYDFLKTMAAYADKTNNLAAVLQQCNNYIAKDPASPAGYLLKGWIFNDMYNDSSKYYFRKAAAIAPKWPYPINGLGNYFSSENNFDSAIYYFNKAIELDSLNSDAYRNRGLAHFILGGYAGKNGMTIVNTAELDAARKDFVMARKLNPSDCYARAFFADHQLTFLKSYQKGSVSYNAYYNNAKTNYLASIECDSNFATGYQKLADLYEYTGDTATALLYLQECVTRNPKNADGFRNLGNFYLQTLADTATAISHFKKAINLDASNGSNYFSLARLYRKQKNRAEAVKVYNSALDRIGSNKDLYNELGNTYFEPPSQFETAISYYKKALQIDSTLAYTCFNLGKLYGIDENTKEQSMYYYGRAVQYNSFRFREMLYPVADYYYYEKRYSEAKPFYQLAFNFASFTRNRDLERLIEILIYEKNFTEAQATLDKYLKPGAANDLYTKLADAIKKAAGSN